MGVILTRTGFAYRMPGSPRIHNSSDMKDLLQSHDYSGTFCFPKDGIILWQFRENDDDKGGRFTIYGFGLPSNSSIVRLSALATAAV